ncbi:sodium:solute symporter family protein [Vibrio sp. SS-MA-C1-2]|uniref:sodium:solute symporter family protein n=1 Tax=Vibrio sp. SS-MA-C1-2 TaxID=2908646 RepID=UPI001F43F67F|nr:sodium:solute symporter family protein [Vibrio sp. SS-MA-C1-2]UJF18462.1 sodium:solute symporter family protein [Vibrio sp. SS-MA-C1-2]
MDAIQWKPLIVIGFFMLGMLYIGYLSSKKLKTSKDFLVGGRNFGLLTVTATQCASAFGGGMMIAHVGIGYKWGFAELGYMTGIFIGGVGLAIFVARWLRQQDFYTTTDWLTHQYGESKVLRTVGSTISMMLTMSWWVAQPVAAGKLLNVLTGMPTEVGILICAVVVMLYTMGGGILAVAYTDVAQLGLMLIAVVVVLPLAISEAGGLETVFATVPEANLTVMAPGAVIVWGWILTLIPGQLVSQIYHQRIYASKTDKIARNSMILKSVASVFMGIWAALLGMSIYTMNPELGDKEAAMTWALVELLPEWLSIIMLGAIAAAIVSTADSALHSTVSSLTRDIYQKVYKPEATDKEIIRFTKLAVMIVGCIGLSIGLFAPSVFSILLMGSMLTASGLLIPLYAGRFWDGGTRQGAISGMIAGVVTSFSCKHFELLTQLPGIAWGIFASAIVYFSVSFATREKAEKRVTART